MSDAIIALSGVAKHFGPVKAVDDISFTIERGKFFSLLGPSGCGKTTLLRMLAGFEQPSHGEIYIDGQPMAGVAANHRPTNMVFQSYAIFPHLNVRENIGYGLRNQRLAAAESARRVADALALVKLADYGDRAAHQLSGGQRQRVALARALVCRPKVLLLDEPLGALDKKLREEMQIELRQLQRTVGITFVFVTHDQEEALTLSDRIAVMSRGKVLQIDSAAGLYENPNCREVAEFIGAMNIIEGRYAGQDKSGPQVETDGLGRFVTAPNAAPLTDKAPVFIAIRPEKLSMSSAKPARVRNLLSGAVAAVTYFGDRSHYLVKVPGLDRPIAVATQNSARGRSLPVKEQDQVYLSWPPEAGLLLTR